MALNAGIIQGTFGNIAGTLSNLPNLLNPNAGLSDLGFYEGAPNILSTATRTNWDQTLPYAFSIQSIDASSSTSTPSLVNSLFGGIASSVTGAASAFSGGSNSQASNGGNPFLEFTLPLNPQNISQDEPFSIIIKPTQGGTNTQHSGTRYRDLVISGTTGNFPFKGAGGVDPFGRAILQPGDLKHASGYEVFIGLRNWFRSYYEWKFDKGAEARNYRLVFKNYKDGEFQIVELLKFSMKRQAGRAFLYDYVLTFRVIGAVNYSALSGINPILADIVQAGNYAIFASQLARGTILRSQELGVQVVSNFSSLVSDPATTIDIISKTLNGGSFVAADFGNELLQRYASASVVNQIYQTVQSNAQLEQSGNQKAVVKPNTSYSSLGTTVSTASTFSSINAPKNIKNSINNSQNPAAFLTSLGENLLNIGTTSFPTAAIAALQLKQQTALANPMEYYQNTQSSLSNVRDIAADQFGLGDAQYNTTFNRTPVPAKQSYANLLDSQFYLLAALQYQIFALNSLMINNKLFTSTYTANLTQYSSEFNGQIPVTSANSTISIIFSANMTLEKLALTYFGDPTRWVDLVVVNNLQPPYFNYDTTDTTPNVIHPGQTLLIPIESTNGFTNLPQVPLLSNFENLTPVQKNFGLDLKLTDNFDLELTPTGDINIVSGIDNLKQAIRLKLAYSPGDLLYHPNIGAGLQPGVITPNLFAVRQQLVNSLLADSRISNVTGVSLKQVGSTLNVDFTVIPKIYGTPLPLSLQVT